MDELLEITNKLKAKEESYEEKANVTQFVCRMLQDAKHPPKHDVAQGLTDFAISEIQELIKLIPATSTYKDKDELFGYADALLSLVMLADPNKSIITEKQIDAIQELIKVNNAERTLENAVSDAFEREHIDVSDINAAIKITEAVTEPYRRGLFFFGLHHYSEKLDALSDDAKAALAEFTAKEFDMLLGKGELCEDEKNYLEYAVDVCKHYYTDELGDALERIIDVSENSVCYYAVDTLIGHGRSASASVIGKLARDLSYANITHFMLEKHRKLDLFPKDCLDPDYLAKSDMVHWLEYPTELGKRPDKIELLGVASKDGETFRIFKYMSDSDTLDDENKNVWLIGWSGDDGGTFSTFAKLSDYEKKTPEKTLKHIVKKLI